MKRIFKIPVRILINEDYNEGYKKYAKAAQRIQVVSVNVIGAEALEKLEDKIGEHSNVPKSCH